MQLINTKCNYIGKNFEYYEEIDSTQNEIWRRINNKKIKNGELIIAGIQTEGKGTHGKIWYTDEPGNIAFSFYTEVNSEIKKFEGITYEIAELIVDIFEKKYNIKLQIKLPNDIMNKNKKIGGILTEAKINKNIIKYLVIGIGINTNQIEFSNNIKNIASSIKKEFNVEVNSQDFINEFCNKFEKIISERINKK